MVVITAVFAINSFVSKFNVWPLLYLLQHPIFQIAGRTKDDKRQNCALTIYSLIEFLFVLFCLRNIYSVTHDIVDPYIEYLQTVGRSYIGKYDMCPFFTPLHTDLSE